MITLKLPQVFSAPVAAILAATLIGTVFPLVDATADDRLSSDDRKLISAVEQHRINAIKRVVGSVIAIYDEDRQGGGSGVIVDPSGIALTNHHVIMGAGVTGWGGLADGQLYRWKLIGTDPGGDVSLIQMEGKQEFPFTPLGDSDLVRVGDWALAMGNPFILTEDQAPTVTLGIVSGVKRYQPGAGLNQLVYGNCIQVDSSINPGNSGGPLFNLNGEVIGINGRGSFKERGRVNVGLGYAISSNQIKNFIPDLLATKLVEHATLDASFADRDGKVVCSQLHLDSPVAAAGLRTGDELLEFEGEKIKNANQFTNLICTLPEDWPTELLFRKEDGTEKRIVVRTLGLPYLKPKAPQEQDDGREKTPEQEQQRKRQLEMVKLLSAPPGEVRFKDTNRKYAEQVMEDWRKTECVDVKNIPVGVARLNDQVTRDGREVGSQAMWLASDGRIRVEWKIDGQSGLYVFDGESFYAIQNGNPRKLSLVEAKLDETLVQAISMAAVFDESPFQMFGAPMIDGSDKALGQNAYRFDMLDEDQDHFYCWLRMYGADGRHSPRLLKSSANKDCEGSGGIAFADWHQVGPVSVAWHREWVSGLSESTSLVINTQSAEWLDRMDESWFQVKAEKISPDAKAARNSESDDAQPDAGGGA